MQKYEPDELGYCENVGQQFFGEFFTCNYNEVSDEVSKYRDCAPGFKCQSTKGLSLQLYSEFVLGPHSEL